MNPDGSGPRRLTGATEAEADWEDHQPVWSPDSTQIAFYRWSFLEGAGIGGGIDLEGDPGLWLVGLDGQPARQLFGFTDLPQFSEAPVWSPDGQWIALNIGNESETDVWVVSSLTGEGVNISGLPGQEMAITWSPDSQSLLFTNIDPNGNLFLYGIDRDGTGLHLLIEEPGLGSADWSSP
jgi:Tol biopolymer transport system component